MIGALAIVAAATVGIDVGWQPLPDGGFEYIIQLEPQTLDSLRDGQDLSSQLPPSLQGVRTYRLTVGNGPLPHEGEPPPAAPASTPSAAAVAKFPAPGGPAPTYPAPTYQAPSYPAPVYQAPPPPIAEPPADPRYAPANPANLRQPTSAAAPTTAPPPGAPITTDVDPSGMLRGLPPPPADPSVPHYEPAPDLPPSAAVTPPDTGATPRPALDTDPRGGTSAAPSSTFPGSPPAIREPAQSSPLPSASPPAASPPSALPSAPPAAESRRESRAAGAANSTKAAETEDTGKKNESDKEHSPAPTSAGESRPWLPLIGTMLALFASLGANVFLGWNTLDLRNRYRTLAAQLHGS